MPISRWIIAVAFGLIAFSSEARSQTATQDQPRQEERSADSQDCSENTYPNPIDFSPALKDIEAAIRDLIAKEDKAEADRKKEAESRDLDAQEQMAKWSYWMTLATIGGVFATFVGLFLIGRTLYHTRRAADYTGDMLEEAKKATVAAEGAVEATRDVGEKQVRAYLHVKRVAFSLGASPGEIGAIISVSNAGQSPAVAVKAEISIERVGTAPVTINIPLPNIAANSDYERELRPIWKKEFGGGMHGAERITVFAKIVAKDVFDKEISALSHRTMHIEGGAVHGPIYDLEDAEGFFPDEVVNFMVERRRSLEEDDKSED